MFNTSKRDVRNRLWRRWLSGDRYAEIDAATLSGLKKYMLNNMHSRISKLKTALVGFMCEAGGEWIKIMSKMCVVVCCSIGENS